MSDSPLNFQPKNLTFSDRPRIFATLVLCSIILWILRYHWKRRNLYRKSAGVPGPRSYPIIGSAYKLMANSTEELFNKFTEIFEQYPGLSKIWLGNKLIYFMSIPEYLDIVMNSTHCLDKSSLYRFTQELVGTGLLTAPVPKWKKHRKIISPAFNQKLLNKFVVVFSEQSKILVSILAKKAGEKEVDISELLNATNLDILCDTLMGVQLKGQTDNTVKLGEWIDTALMVLFMRSAVIWYQIDAIFNLTKMSKIYRKAVGRVHDYTNEIISEKLKTFKEKEERLKNGEEIEEEAINNNRKSLLDILMNLSFEGAKLTKEELQEEVTTFVIAGSDTTATTLSFCFTMLGMHQDLQQQILQEVLDILGPDRDATFADLPQLDLMDRFIKETLRLFPTAPYIFRASDEDVDLGDAILPKYCKVCLGIFIVHRNEKYWKDPLKFDPDRFLPSEVAKRHPYSYVAFSGGPRNCVGYRYAMMSVKTVLSTVIRKFVVKTSYKTVDEVKLKANLVIRPKNGYKVSFELRK